MKPSKVLALAGALLGTQVAHAGLATPLGAVVALPLVEGGLLGVAAAALVVGVRIVRAKSKR
jgi:hypothetical protein